VKLGDDAKEHLKKKLRNAEFFSLSLDESGDITGTAQNERRYVLIVDGG
jgi:hypothetical protein